MAYAAIRDYLKAQLLTVSGIGQVHDYTRLNRFYEDAKNRLVSNGKVSAWTIVKGQERRDWHGANIQVVTHRIGLVGVYGLKDDSATEKTFLALVEAVVNKLRQDYNLGGACLTTDPPEVYEIGYQNVLNVLCHTATISLTAYERIVL